MKNPPIKKASQDDYVKTSLRIPRDLHARLMEAGQYNGRTLNAEILDRLHAAPVYELLAEIARENAEMKIMLREMHNLTVGK